MFTMEIASEKDLAVWRGFDPHVAEGELLRKFSGRQCYVLKEDSVPAGVLRYNLFWDSIPFLTLLWLAEPARRRGYGKAAMLQWERDMRALGYSAVMTSTQSDEEAQHFYRRLGYRDAGCLILDLPELGQPTELFFIKQL